MIKVRFIRTKRHKWSLLYNRRVSKNAMLVCNAQADYRKGKISKEQLDSIPDCSNYTLSFNSIEELILHLNNARYQYTPYLEEDLGDLYPLFLRKWQAARWDNSGFIKNSTTMKRYEKRKEKNPYTTV